MENAKSEAGKTPLPSEKMSKPLRRKLHLNWDAHSMMWLVKKAFNFVPPVQEFKQADLEKFLTTNPDIEIVARYI